jgi:hypothetical protein
MHGRHYQVVDLHVGCEDDSLTGVVASSLRMPPLGLG